MVINYMFLFFNWSIYLINISTCFRQKRHDNQVQLMILNWVFSYEKVWKLVAQFCPTLGDPMDWSPPVSSAHGILQARIQGWVAIPFSRGSSWPRDWTWVSCTAGKFFTVWATREALFLKFFFNFFKFVLQFFLFYILFIVFCFFLFSLCSILFLSFFKFFCVLGFFAFFPALCFYFLFLLILFLIIWFEFWVTLLW